jgi:hypothetical protein
MDPVALDFETCRFAPGMMAPPPVCASTYHPQDGARIWVTSELPAMIERVFSERNPVLGHGFAYDGCVALEWFPELAKLIWRKYEEDGIIDSLTTERIIEISTGVRGKLALDELARRYGIEVRKSCVRTDFGRYLDAPLSEYTREHKRYVIGDTAELYQLSKRQLNRGIVSRKDLGDLVRGDLWLRLSANWGIRTDPSRVDQLESSTQADVEDLTVVAQEWGGMQKTMTPAQQRDGKWYSRNTKMIKDRVLKAYGWEHAPKTDSWDAGLDRKGFQTDPRGQKSSPDYDPHWGISISKTSLDESGDPILEAMSHLGEMLAVRNKDVKMLKQGVYAPIHTRYGYAATTRTTSSAPNIQNFRKKRGIRECLIPRDGMCFVETDYPSLELFTLGQVCAWKLGRYDLVKAMNNGKDFHAVVGANILGTTYEDVMARKGTDEKVKNARDCGKYGNYGLCGYMTDPETFQLYVNMGSRTEDNPKGAQITVDQAAFIMAEWNKNAGDPVHFLKYVDTLKNQIGLYDVEIPGTTIIRRGCTRTAAANTHFQGLGATVARRAGWLLARRQYIERSAPGRTVVFCHDAFLGECRIADRDALALAQEECMAQAMAEICPDMVIVPELEAKRRGLTPGKDCCIIDSAAQDHYSKFAKSKRDSAGSLIICQV